MEERHVGKAIRKGILAFRNLHVHIKLRNMSSFVLMTLVSGNKTALDILIYESLAYKRY